MRGIKYVLIAAIAIFLMTSVAAPQPVEAQISFGLHIGTAPACPYGYYGYSPYRCAPYGYYGPEWFGNGVFIGAGPWFHGPRGFYGHVNHHFDPRYGYRGRYPAHGAYHEQPDHFQNFHGSRLSDSHGHYRSESRHGSSNQQHNDGR